MARWARLGLLVALALGDPALAMEPEERLQFANGLFRRGLYDLAIPEYEALTASATAGHMHDMAWFRLAESYRNLGRTNEAAAAYERIVADYPASTFVVRANFRRAEIDWQQGRLRDAVTRFEALLKTQPPAEIEAAALYFSGVAYVSLDRFRDAERALRRAVRTHGDSAYGHVARMALADLIIQQEGDATEAAALLEVIAADPSADLAGEALAKRGRLAYRNQQMEEASRWFTALADRYPKHPWNGVVALDAAWAHLLAGKPEVAAPVGRRELAAAKGEARVPWWYFLANLERLGGNNAAARKQYEALLAGAPQHELAATAAFEAAGLAFADGDYTRTLALAALAAGGGERDLALLWMKAGSLRALARPEEARAMYQKIIDGHPASDRAPAAAYQLALMLDEAGDAGAAAEAFAKIADAYPENPLAPECLMAAASVRLRAGETARAVSAWSALVRRYPSYARLDEALAGLARAQVQLEKDGDAQKTLQRLMKDFPESRYLAEAMYLRGSLYEKNESFDQAAASYTRALAADPVPALARQIQGRQVAVLQRQGNNAGAASLLNEMLREDEALVLPSPLLEWLARWNLEQQDHGGAAMAAQRLAASASAPGWQQLGYFINGVAQRALGKTREATAAFHAAAAMSLNTRETALAWYALGELAAEADDHAAAVDYFSRAAGQAASDAAMDVRARSYLALGKAHEALGQAAEAVRHYLIVGVLYDDPSVTPESLYRAAAMQAALGRTREREQTLAELRERYPDHPRTQEAGAP